MIYILEIMDYRFVKIGFTSKDDVSLRVAQLQTGCPFEIKIANCVQGSLLQEKEIHKALKVAFGRSNIPVPPNEWYPSRSNIIKFFLPILVDKGINSSLAYLDKFNPSVNSKEHHEGVRSYDVKLEWPVFSEDKCNRVLGYRTKKRIKTKDQITKPSRFSLHK